jgi:autotransporter-associated beta strand protein
MRFHFKTTLGRRVDFRVPLAAVVAATVALSISSARADIIYRETFGNTLGSRQHPNVYGWQTFQASGAQYNTIDGNHGVDTSTTLGRPTDVANVNAGPNQDGSFDALSASRYFWNGNRRLAFTPEYSINPVDYVPGSIVFSFYLGNNNSTANMDPVRVAIRVNTTWYVSVQTFSTPQVASANFATAAELKSLTFSPAAANWQILNFDGTYNGGGYPGGPTAVVTDSSTAMSLSPNANDLSGPITAFGILFVAASLDFATNPQSNIRFDTFQVDATPNSVVVGKNVSWEGALSGDWDTNTANWRTNAGPATTYAEGDFALFGDSALTNIINLVSLHSPGSVTVSNASLNYTFNGIGSIGSGRLTKQGAASLLVANSSANSFSAVRIDGGTVLVGDGGTSGSLGSANITNHSALVFNRSDSLIVNNAISGTGSLSQNGTGTLTLSGASSYTGQTLVNSGTLVLNGNISGGGLLTSAAGTTLAGSGANSGPVQVSGQITPGTSAGTITAGGLTLQPGASATFELGSSTTVGGGVNDLIQVNGNLTLNNNAVSISLLGPPQTGVPYRLVNYTGARSGAFNPSVTIIGGGRFSASLDYSTANQVNLVFSGSVASLKWTSDGSSSSRWDVGTTTNWLNLGSSLPDVFYLGDNVLFDDTAPQSTVSINDSNNAAITVQAGLVTVTNETSVYSITGPGKISGATSIVKNGSGTLTLSSANDFTGPVSVNAGTLVVGNNSALGTTNGSTTIANGATLDVGNPTAGANAVNLGTELVIVSGSGVGGNGAIVNNTSTAQQNALQRVTLTGHTVFGGSARWDIRATGAQLSTGGGAYNITKIGGNQVNIVTATVDPSLANIEVQSGMLGLQTLTGIGNPAGTLTVFNGATLRLTDSAAGVVLVKGLILQDGATVNNTSGANSWGGPVTLQGTVTFTVSGTSLTLTNVLGGSGSLVKVGGSALILTASNTCTGGISIEAGRLALTGVGSIEQSSPVTVLSTLDVSARTDGTLNLTSGHTLRGTGTVNGKLLAKAGSTVSPGVDAIGTLTITNLVTLQGATVMELDKGVASQDLIQSSATINYGGTLLVTNLSQGTSPLALGDSFKLFNATTYTGAFAGIVPPTPGTGLAWDTSQLTVDGTLRVDLPRPTIGSIIAAGGTVSISGSGGPANGTYYVLASANVALPLTNWVSIATNTFDGTGHFNFSTAIDTSIPSRFFVLQVP